LVQCGSVILTRDWLRRSPDILCWDRVATDRRTDPVPEASCDSERNQGIRRHCLRSGPIDHYHHGPTADQVDRVVCQLLCHADSRRLRSFNTVVGLFWRKSSA
jgi:hypothetical protein